MNRIESTPLEPEPGYERLGTQLPNKSNDTPVEYPTTPSVGIRVPAPHAKQQLIESSTAKRVVVNAGRRFGKSTLATRVAVKSASRGTRVLYIAPINAQSDTFWFKCLDWLTPAIKAKLISTNETSRRINFLSSGGSIQCRSADKPNSLRGDTADIIILDEYALMLELVWNSVVAPMTLDSDAQVYFISTPKPGGPFKRIYLTAKANEDNRYEIFEASSYDNPFLSPEALADITQDMTEDQYQQEILAKFIPGEGQVFTNIEPNLYKVTLEEVNKHKNHHLLIAIDWGMKHDKTAISIGCRTCRREIELIRLKSMEYPAQQDFIKKLAESYKPENIYAESNSIGLPNIQALRNSGLTINPFETTAQSKREIIQMLKLALEKETWKFIDHPIANIELEAYEMKLTPLGQPTYNAPAGMNDDTVISRAILVWGAEYGRLIFV